MKNIIFSMLLNLLAHPNVSTATPDPLVGAQIRQLNAQAAYYETESGAWHIATSALSNSLGALLGALVAFLSLHAQARFQARREDVRLEQSRREEKGKWERDRALAKEGEVRSIAAELAKRIAMAANSMTWVLWIAKNDKKRFDAKSVDEHDHYMKNLYSEIAAAQVSLAAVDQKLYSESLQLVYKLYNLDGEIALCATRLPESIDELGNLWERSRNFETEIPSVFSDILNQDNKNVPANPCHSSSTEFQDSNNAQPRGLKRTADAARLGLKTLGGPNKELPVRTFLGVTVAWVLLTQGFIGRNEDPVSSPQPSLASADSAGIDCREIQGGISPVLECRAFDLIVSESQDQPLPLATLSRVLSAGGIATTESTLMIGGSRHPALRIEKQRSDGGRQIGWATIVVVDGIERNVTCYLHPPQTEEKACVDGLSQLSSGQLRFKVN